MKFKDYSLIDEIKDQLESLGFKRPTDIQHRAIKPILDGEDVMAVAQTGTGKTAAFVIPMLHKFATKKRGAYKGIRGLVLVPTRELAKQISDVVVQIGAKTPVSVLGLYGGVEQEKQITQLKNGLDILVSTPGRMFDLIAQGYIDLSKLEMLVLDEADLMLDLGFTKDIHDVLKKIPKKRQTLFFSATMPPEIQTLANVLLTKPAKVEVTPVSSTVDAIDQSLFLVDKSNKPGLLLYLLKNEKIVNFDGVFISIFKSGNIFAGQNSRASNFMGNKG